MSGKWDFTVLSQIVCGYRNRKERREAVRRTIESLRQTYGSSFGVEAEAEFRAAVADELRRR